MKKKIVAVVLVAGLAMATAASAQWGRGGGGGGYWGACPQGQYAQQVDPAVQEKLDKFYLETQDLRKQLVVKQAERRALLQGANPDPAAVSKAAGELFDLQTAMHDKAVAAGVDRYIGGPKMMGGGRGPGMGPGGRGGRMMGGPGY